MNKAKRVLHKILFSLGWSQWFAIAHLAVFFMNASIEWLCWCVQFFLRYCDTDIKKPNTRPTMTFIHLFSLCLTILAIVCVDCLQCVLCAVLVSLFHCTKLWSLFHFAWIFHEHEAWLDFALTFWFAHSVLYVVHSSKMERFSIFVVFSMADLSMIWTVNVVQKMECHEFKYCCSLFIDTNANFQFNLPLNGLIPCLHPIKWARIHCLRQLLSSKMNKWGKKKTRLCIVLYAMSLMRYVKCFRNNFGTHTKSALFPFARIIFGLDEVEIWIFRNTLQYLFNLEKMLWNGIRNKLFRDFNVSNAICYGFIFQNQVIWYIHTCRCACTVVILLKYIPNWQNEIFRFSTLNIPMNALVNSGICSIVKQIQMHENIFVMQFHWSRYYLDGFRDACVARILIIFQRVNNFIHIISQKVCVFCVQMQLECFFNLLVFERSIRIHFFFGHMKRVTWCGKKYDIE